MADNYKPVGASRVFVVVENRDGTIERFEIEQLSKLITGIENDAISMAHALREKSIESSVIGVEQSKSHPDNKGQ